LDKGKGNHQLLQTKKTAFFLAFLKKKYGFFFENYTANKTNCKVVSLKIRKPYAKIIRVVDYDEENGRMPRRKQFSLFEVIGD
jgi:hypothetical protein